MEGSDEEDAGWCETGMGIVSRGSFLVYCSNPGTERLTPCLGIHCGSTAWHPLAASLRLPPNNLTRDHGSRGLFAFTANTTVPSI